jgi:hypothetical protein
MARIPGPRLKKRLSEVDIKVKATFPASYISDQSAVFYHFMAWSSKTFLNSAVQQIICNKRSNRITMINENEVKLSRNKSWRKVCGEEVELLLVLDLETRWGEWSASRSDRALPSGLGPPGTDWIGGWVGPTAGLDAEAKKKGRISFAGGRTRIVHFVVSQCKPE